MARIKAWLLVTRDTTRDYLDTAVLLERLGETAAMDALASLDELYAQPTGVSPLTELAQRLSAANPQDLARIELASYRGLRAPWSDWAHVAACGRKWGQRVAKLALDGVP